MSPIILEAHDLTKKYRHTVAFSTLYEISILA